MSQIELLRTSGLVFVCENSLGVCTQPPFRQGVAVAGPSHSASGLMLLSKGCPGPEHRAPLREASRSGQGEPMVAEFSGYLSLLVFSSGEESTGLNPTGSWGW